MKSDRNEGRLNFCRWVVMATSLIACSQVIGAERGDNELWWPHWRGPSANGVVEAGAPPTEWSATKNIRWVTALPGTGASTPIVVGDRMFVLSAEDTGKSPSEPVVKHPDALTEPPNTIHRFWLLALDRHSGKELFRRVLAEDSPHEGHHKTNTYAGGSPVTDGERLYVSLGSRGIFACDLDGNTLWERRLGKLRTRRGWGEASTPGLHGDRLVVPWDQEEQSQVVCLNKATGAVEWSLERDEPTNWSTPVFVPDEAGVQVVLNGTNRARGYRLADGEPVWEVGSLSVNAIPTPIFDEQTIYCMSGYRKSIIYAVSRGAKGDAAENDGLRWTFGRHTPYVASPLLYQGRLYMTKNLGNRLTILDSRDGSALVEAEPLPELANVYASPVAVNGFVYIVDREGKTAVLRAGDRLDLVSVNRINDTVDASPVVIEDRLYLRSWSAVYCIGEN